MKKVNTIISITTGLLTVYTAVAAISQSFALVFFLFLTCTGLFFYMVLCILKDAPPSQKTFDEYFYDDVDGKNY